MRDPKWPATLSQVCVQLRRLHDGVPAGTLSSTQTDNLVGFVNALNALLPSSETVSYDDEEEEEEQTFYDALEQDGEEGEGEAHGDGTLILTDVSP